MDKNTLKLILLKQEEMLARRLSRPIAERDLSLDKEINAAEISIVTGVRRSGKSLFLAQLKRRWESKIGAILVEFDDPSLQAFQGSDFPHLIDLCSERCLDKKSKKLLLLDEIQNVPQWERWLPQLAKDPTLKIVITGSNAKLLSSELGTLLTGRHLSHEMTPLSFCEALRFDHPAIASDSLSKDQLQITYERYYSFGGFPRSYTNSDPSVLPQYFVDIVERDIIARHGARLRRSLKELARVLASNNTRLINRSKTAKELAVKDEGTIRRYTGWFEECYLFHELKGFHSSVRKQMRSNPKYYCIDPALARLSAFSVMGDLGSFLENLVYLELRRRGYELYYWRAGRTDSEVDFVARKGGEESFGVQVALTIIDETTLRREIEGLTALQTETGISKLILITNDESKRTLTVGTATIEILPFVLWAARLV